MSGFLSFDEYQALLLSLQVSGVAIVSALPFAFAAALLLARTRFAGKTLVDGLVHLPLVLPGGEMAYEWDAAFKDQVRQSAVLTLAGADYKLPGVEHYSNTAVLMAGSGWEVAHYNKRRLVPFGEYIPLTETLPFMKYLQSITRDQYQPGLLPSPIWVACACW